MKIEKYLQIIIALLAVIVGQNLFHFIMSVDDEKWVDLDEFEEY